MAKERYDAFPSRMMLQTFKGKKKAAALGHSLLKKKADALKAKQRELLEEIFEKKLELDESIKNAYFSHTKATYAAGNFNQSVLAGVQRASCKLSPKRQNVTGVELLGFERVEERMTTTSALGLSRGGEQIDRCKTAFTHTLELLVRLGALQTSFQALEQAIKVTNRRVNALEFVVVPKMNNTIAYISSELDEREREDLFRLKKVIENKKKLQNKAAEEKARRAQELGLDTEEYVEQGNALDAFSIGQGDDDMVMDLF